jgi:hypothetical protein
MHADQWLFFCHSNGFLPKLGITEQDCMKTFDMANKMDGLSNFDASELDLTEFCYCMILLAIRVGFLVEEEGEIFSPLLCTAHVADAVVSLLDVMTNGKVKRGQKFQVRNSILCLGTSHKLITPLQAPKAHSDLYRQTLGKDHQRSGFANMPVLSKIQLDGVLTKIEQQQHTIARTPNRLLKTPDRKVESRSPNSMRTSSVATTPSSVELSKLNLDARSPAFLGISGFNFKSEEYLGTSPSQKLIGEVNASNYESEQLPGTPVALMRSSSLPSTGVSSAESQPTLNRSNSNVESGAAIKAALGSHMFASFRRASLASVLEKVKTTVEEQQDGSPNDKTSEIKENGIFECHEHENMLENTTTTPEGRALWALEERVVPNSEAKVALEGKHEISERKIRLQSMCYEFESAEMREALDQVAETGSRTNASARKIQKVWKFDQIAEIPARPYSGLKKNAGAGRRLGSAVSLQTNFERIELEANPNGTPRSMSSSFQDCARDKTRILDKSKENKIRERPVMGPGGFWRASLHSASTEAIQRKMPDFVANIAEVRQQILICDVCQSLSSKDVHGRCKRCGA